MVATSGDVLLEPKAIDSVRRALLPRAWLVTPNIPEAATLLGVAPAGSEAQMRAQAEALMQFGCGAVLIKGGHGEGTEAVDVLFDGEGHHVLSLPRVATRNTHGTGCTLSAAIAAHLAEGQSLGAAVSAAKHFVWEALKASAGLSIGRGNGPLDHGFALRKILVPAISVLRNGAPVPKVWHI